MARKRFISPDFHKHEGLSDLDRRFPAGGAKPGTSFAHRFLFSGLWGQADREGRLRDRPRRLKVELLPWDDLSIDDIDEALNRLHDAEFVIRYEVDGERYIAIPGFPRHQTPHVREMKSIIPPPPKRPRGSVAPRPVGKPPDDEGLERHDLGSAEHEAEHDLGSASERKPAEPGPSPAQGEPRQGEAQVQPSPRSPDPDPNTDPDTDTDTPDGEPVVDPPDKAEAIRQVFEHWSEARGKPNAKFTDDRKRKIRARLREKFTVEQLCTAIDGVARDPWPDRRLHDDLTIILRDGSQVEKFLALAKPGGNGAPASYSAPRRVPTSAETDKLLEQRNAMRGMKGRIGRPL